MEIGELVATVFLKSQIDEKCPFKETEIGPSNTEGENIEKDDANAAEKEQANNGGTLGENLTSGSAGKNDTIGGPFTANNRASEPANDTKRSGGKLHMFVRGTELIEDGKYPFHQAAHHLIPGKASLKPSELMRFMTKGESVHTSTGKSFKVNSYIGYNVNGSHNGIWLPGNYAIRKKGEWKKTPVENSNWKKLEALHADWQMNYSAAAAKASGAQFHDTHTEYNDSVKKLLNKIAMVLFAHQEFCEDCKDKKEIPPPFLVKERLYNISNYLKSKLTGPPIVWKRP